jgi:hypothetical protein
MPVSKAYAATFPPLTLRGLRRLQLLSALRDTRAVRVPEEAMVSALKEKHGMTFGGACRAVSDAVADGHVERRLAPPRRRPLTNEAVMRNPWLLLPDSVSLTPAGERFLRVGLEVERLRPDATPDPRSAAGRVFWRVQTLRLVARLCGGRPDSLYLRKNLYARGLNSGHAERLMRAALNDGQVKVVGREFGGHWVPDHEKGSDGRRWLDTGAYRVALTAAGKEFLADHAGVPVAPLRVLPPPWSRPTTAASPRPTAARVRV